MIHNAVMIFFCYEGEGLVARFNGKLWKSGSALLRLGPVHQIHFGICVEIEEIAIFSTSTHVFLSKHTDSNIQKVMVVTVSQSTALSVF